MSLIRMDPVDLADFLLARIAEDEAVARSASPGPWHLNAEQDEVLAVDDITVCEGFALSGPQTRATTAHIARHDPARVLAECAAKQRIVDWHRPVDGLDDDDQPVRGCPNCIASGAVAPHLIAGPCLTVRLLALPYADHPDYHKDWRP